MKRMFLALGFVAALAACTDEGNRPASEGYIDSTTATPNSTVNPPDNTSAGLDTTSSGTGAVSKDTAMRSDTTGRSGGRDSAR